MSHTRLKVRPLPSAIASLRTLSDVTLNTISEGTSFAAETYPSLSPSLTYVFVL